MANAGARFDLLQFFYIDWNRKTDAKRRATSLENSREAGCLGGKLFSILQRLLFFPVVLTRRVLKANLRDALQTEKQMRHFQGWKIQFRFPRLRG
jgi:hypothetical protein